jgi:hypothetical protein
MGNHPYIEGEFKLQMNRKENCPPPTQLETATRGIVGSPGTVSTHFNDIDRATDTRLGLFPFMWAGFRIGDLRDPARLVEVGYFKPGDACMSHVHCDTKTAQIWFACTCSGLYVIELASKLRASLNLAFAQLTTTLVRLAFDFAGGIIGVRLDF